MCHSCIEIAKMGEMTQKFGYMDVKQSSKVRGRKLKTWRKKWVVFTKMSDLSSYDVVGKLDLYENEEKWKSDPRNKLTFILEHVTSVRRSSSRTHPHAFEIVERQPTFVLSGTTELESYSWLLTLQQIFTPEMVESTKDSYIVGIEPNDDSRKWKLDGEYHLNVGQNGVSLIEGDGLNGHVKISWGLSTLMRFNMEKASKTGETQILSIKCGPNSPTGEGTFKFISDEVQEIIKTIRHHICVVLASKQNCRREGSYRIRSISATYSEDNFMALLDNQSVFQDQFRTRSSSESSGSTLSPTSPSIPDITSCDPLMRGDSCKKTGSYKSGLNLGVLDELEEHTNTDTQDGLGEKDRQDSGCCSEIVSFEGHEAIGSFASEEGRTTSGAADHGYSVIKDVSSAEKAKDDPNDQVSQNKSLDSIPAQKISAQVSEVLIFPASFASDFHELAANNKLENGYAEEQANWSSTSSLRKKSDKGSDVIYQEVGKTGAASRCENFPMTPGNLNRRRSSSTPDLHAFWKSHGFDTGFENIYEELDEHRRLFFRRSHNKTKEIPPALPARPFTMNFSTAPKDTGNQPVVRLKKSILGKSHAGKEKQQPSDSRTAGQKVKKCSCQSPNSMKRRSNSKKSTCPKCGSDIKSASNASPTLGVAPPESPVSNKPHRDKSPKTSQAKLKPNSQSGTSFSSQGSETGILIDIDSDEVQPNRSATPSFHYDTPATRPCSRNDPLIGFFLDDHMFDTNPLVTGELEAKLNCSTPTKHLSEEQPTENHNSQQPNGRRSQLTHQRSLPTPVLERPMCPSPVRQRSQTNSPPKADAFMKDAFLTSTWTNSNNSCQFASHATTSPNLFKSYQGDCSQIPVLNDPWAFNVTSPVIFPSQTSPPLVAISTSNSNVPQDDTYMAMSHKGKTASLPNPFGVSQMNGIPATTPFDPFMTIRDENWTPFDVNANLNIALAERSISEESETSSDNIYVSPGFHLLS